MKTSQKLTGIFTTSFIAVMMLISACDSDKPIQETAKPVAEQNETGNIKGLAAMASPFPASKYHYVKAMSGLAYSLVSSGGDTVIPNIINPLVNSQAMINYYNKINSENDNKFNGLRFYPGFKNNTLILIMCLAEYDEDDDSKKDEAGYYIMENNLYMGNQLNITSTNQPKTLFEAYKNNILINSKSQIGQTTVDNTVRDGRFYLWTDFLSLLDQNQGGNFIQIDIGYADKHIVENYPAWLLNKFTIEQQQGFTVLFHIKDNNGNSLMDPHSKYETNAEVARQNFRNRGLEVGVPCPPRCGSLISQ